MPEPKVPGLPGGHHNCRIAFLYSRTAAFIRLKTLSLLPVVFAGESLRMGTVNFSTKGK